MKIEKNIPIPKTYSTKKKNSVAQLFDACEDVGDSFFVRSDEMKEVALRHAYMRWADKIFRKKRFTIRKVEGGFRCWRTE